jgi:dolichyl-phosphate beta-glucosyltransferase
MSTESLVSLSVVIPAYNEQARIEASLRGIIDAMPSIVSSDVWEVVVANDGSTDETARIVAALAHEEPRLQLLNLPHRGKGAAVRDGILASRGSMIIFSDADLATPIAEATKLLSALQTGADVAIGSREADGAVRIDEPFLRHAMGRVFSATVRVILLKEFADTQCGFKAFTREAAQSIFSRVVLYGADAPVLQKASVTGFDVEVLYIALQSGLRISEVPVEWHYRTNSKVSPIRDSYALLKDVLQVRFNGVRGVYDCGTPEYPLLHAPSESLSDASETALIRG